jgi:hypothetical protein
VTQETLEGILAGGAASAAQPVPDADEKETLITDPVENKIGTDQVEGESPDDTKDKGEPDPERDKVGAAFKGVREGERKRYTEQIADFEKKMEAQNAQWQARFDQMMAHFAPKQDPAQPPDFFENPQAAVRAELEPVLQAVQAQNHQFSFAMATDKHGSEAVNQAVAWITAKKSADPTGFQTEYTRIMNNPHPYGELVAAHKRSQVLSEIGDDPASYKERLKAELLAEMQSSSDGRSPAVPGSRSPAAPAVMPSNFADARNAGTRAAAWEGPTSLRDIFSKR